MFRASLRPSSGGQTAFSLPVVFCPVVTVVMLGRVGWQAVCTVWSRLHLVLLLLSVGLPVANVPDALQPCGLLYYP